MTQSAGIAATLAAYADRLTDEDAALVALATGLAEAVDESPGNAALWKELRAAIATLSEVMSRGVDDDTADLRATFLTPLRATMGDSEVA